MGRNDRPPGSLEVRKAVERGEFPRVWLWSGPEDYLKDEIFALIAAALGTEGMGSLNVSRFRAGSDEVGQVVATCCTLPMLADRRAVYYVGLDDLNRRDYEKLLEYAQDPCPETVLVVAGTGPPGDAKHRDLGRTAGVEQAVFWIPYLRDAARWVQIRFRELGKQCDAETAQELLELCGWLDDAKVSLREAAPEIEKVALNAGDRDRVGADDLAVIARRADQRVLYEIARQVGKRDLPGALRALEEALLFKDNPGVRILANLMYFLTELEEAAAMAAAGAKDGDIGRVIGSFRLKRLAGAHRAYSPAAVRRGLMSLARADRTLKSSPKNPRVVLEKALADICLAAN